MPNRQMLRDARFTFVLSKKISSPVNMAARMKVGILGLALNPKKWTIGRLASKAGEGREK